MSLFTAEWRDLFTNHLPWDQILPLYYKEFPTEEGFKTEEELVDFFKEMLQTTGEWVEEKMLPRAKELDTLGAGELENGRTIPSEALAATYKDAAELGILGASADKEFGGLGLPGVIHLFIHSQMHQVDIGVGTQLSFFSSIADMVERFCDHETAARVVPQIIEGKLSGSMNLTEAGAGSDVGSLTTSAVKQEDGSYLLNGAKIFITNAGGGVAFILARVKGAPEGLDGISLFFAEQFLPDKEEMNYRVTKVEEKMGMHSSFTCEVVYENTVAHLVGEENQGLEYMFHLMNESRIGCGLQGLAGMEGCLRNVESYAASRKQFGRDLMDLPLYKANINKMQTERDAFRCLMVDTYGWFDLYAKLDMMNRKTKDLTESQQELFKQAKKICRKRTPLVKYYGSEAFCDVSVKSIQALGGYGFMKEYDVERLHRDSFAPLLYEGTSQIQALMSMKDLLKFIMKNPQRYFQTLWEANPLGNLIAGGTKWQKAYRGQLYDFKKNLLKLLIRNLSPEIDVKNLNDYKKIFASKEWATLDSIERLMVHAETICQAQSYLETIRVMVKMNNKDQKRDALFQSYIKLVEPRFEAIYTEWKQ